MKKNYMMLALAAVMGLSASAVAPQRVNTAAENLQVLSQEEVMSMLPAPSQLKKAAAPARISSRQDVIGIYNGTYQQWMLSGADSYKGKLNVYIGAGESDNELNISGLNQITSEPVIGTIDVAAGTIKISNQDIERFDNVGQNSESSMLALRIMKANMETEKWEDATEAIGKVGNDGSIDFSEYAFMFQWVDLDGYNAGYGFIALQKGQYFTFNEAEWTKLDGKALFTDGWIRAICEDTTPFEVECDVYQNKAEAGKICVVDPYTAEIWDGMNTPPTGQTKHGFLAFDMTEPLCVPTLDLVPSGFWLAMGETEAEIEEMYLKNRSGYQVNQLGMYVDEILDNCYAVSGVPEEDLSYYDETTNVITFRNLLFGQTTNPNAVYWWTNDQDVREAYVQMPANFGGVENIEFDVNAPVKYYNLQGLEVANPAKGQLVIKTQGGKSVKTIIK